MGEPADDLLAVDSVLGEVDRFWWAGVGLGWGELAEGAVRLGGVVVVGADNLCHLGRCSAERGLASSAGRAELGRPDVQ